jgi:HK97 family phage major capsid protein
VEEQLPAIGEAIKTADGTTTVGAGPTYWEPGSIRNQSDFGTLYGRPVIPLESCSALGDVGDIILCSLGQYLTVTKIGGIRADVSMHLWFDYDMSAFRFVLRMAGAPELSAPISRANSSNTLSAFVTLAAR